MCMRGRAPDAAEHRLKYRVDSVQCAESADAHQPERPCTGCSVTRVVCRVKHSEGRVDTRARDRVMMKYSNRQRSQPRGNPRDTPQMRFSSSTTQVHPCHYVGDASGAIPRIRSTGQE